MVQGCALITSAEIGVSIFLIIKISAIQVYSPIHREYPHCSTENVQSLDTPSEFKKLKY